MSAEWKERVALPRAVPMPSACAASRARRGDREGTTNKLVAADRTR